MVTRYQYKILKKALRNCGFTPINQREVDACKYLFNKKNALCAQDCESTNMKSRKQEKLP